MEELKSKLDDIFCEVDRHYYSGVIEPLAGKELLKMIQQAIDYIPCCKSDSELLCDDKPPKYGTKEWLEMARKIYKDA
jgi:hypothetical protein